MFYKSPEVNPSKWSSQNQKLPLGMCMDMCMDLYLPSKNFFNYTSIYIEFYYQNIQTIYRVRVQDL